MRYNEKELRALSRQPAELAAELGMRGPKKGSVLKRRLVKLVVNFLFYFRTDEAEPIGALLLEHCRVIKEEPSVFSISFIEDPERKYHFECSSEEQCEQWTEALRQASYEFMRKTLISYRNEIQKMTGPPGAVRHFRGGQVPAEQLEGVSAQRRIHGPVGWDWVCPALHGALRLAVPWPGLDLRPELFSPPRPSPLTASVLGEPEAAWGWAGAAFGRSTPVSFPSSCLGTPALAAHSGCSELLPARWGQASTELGPWTPWGPTKGLAVLQASAKLPCKLNVRH
ncbi:pleckstrin homology domain-containing family J member 1 isoform X1 [Choloepus didactylus]|uniref:pleckstrin homology domain-containing family J member 1 isoform X1 n=1 Tax=Choloepus didactylus TaxID=27675 RepID=UPI00189DF54A|nr:pleckstrin homology domain-containing family J member 1 isoform X1 [Choloepus didactylus]